MVCSLACESRRVTGDVLVFVEDPGAVNCVVPVVSAMSSARAPLRLFSTGHATAMLRERGLSPNQLPPSQLEQVFSGNPSALLVGTSEIPRSLAFELIRQARTAGIPSAAILDSSANAEHRFRGLTNDPLHHAPDHLLVPDGQLKQVFAALGHVAHCIHVVGHPNDDRVRAIGVAMAAEGRARIRREQVPDAGARPVIIFVSEVSDGLEPGAYQRSADYTLQGRGGRHLRTEIVAEEFLDAVASLALTGENAPFLVLRRHPKETADDLRDLLPEFDHVSQGGDPHRLIFAADLVVGMTTMLLAEAALLGVPAMSILPRLSETGWLAVLRDNKMPVAVTRAMVVDRLSHILAARSAPPLAAIEPMDHAVRKILACLEMIAR